MNTTYDNDDTRRIDRQLYGNRTITINNFEAPKGSSPLVKLSASLAVTFSMALTVSVTFGDEIKDALGISKKAETQACIATTATPPPPDTTKPTVKQSTTTPSPSKDAKTTFTFKTGADLTLSPKGKLKISPTEAEVSAQSEGSYQIQLSDDITLSLE